MTTWEHVDVYADDNEQKLLVTEALGGALFRGELSLFLGGGVSNAFGFPDWRQLVNYCVLESGANHPPVAPPGTFEELTRAARACHDASNGQYLEIVKRGLYNAGTIPHDRNALSTSALLNALGALMMGSRRGRIREVWTLNYDDILEWHLRTHGFVSQVVTEVPTLLRDVDVTVYHPHGFLPLQERHGVQSKAIVLDDQSYAKRSLGKHQPWRDAVQVALRSKIFLAIGLSWSDKLVRDLVIEATDDVRHRPTAFWFFGPNTDPVVFKDCVANNVVPLTFSSFDDYAPFLRGICEGAMDSVA